MYPCQSYHLQVYAYIELLNTAYCFNTLHLAKDVNMEDLAVSCTVLLKTFIKPL